jgi:hypothetical protein
MNPAEDNSAFQVSAGVLPIWWRYVLVATATLILCSCQALPTPPQNPAQPASKEPAEPATLFTDDSAAEPAKSVREPVEARQLAPQDLALEWPPQQGTCRVAPPPFATNSCCPASCNACNERALGGPGDEYLCDGGDFGLPVGVRADWTVDGLEQEDTIAHYDTVSGNVIVTPSNRVCIYAPRFAAIRRVESVAAEERRLLIGVAQDDLRLANAQKDQPVAKLVQRHGVAIDVGQQPVSLFRGRQQAGGMEDLLAVIDVNGTLAAYADLQIIRAGQVVGS